MILQNRADRDSDVSESSSFALSSSSRHYSTSLMTSSSSSMMLPKKLNQPLLVPIVPRSSEPGAKQTRRRSKSIVPNVKNRGTGGKSVSQHRGVVATATTTKGGSQQHSTRSSGAGNSRFPLIPTPAPPAEARRRHTATVHQRNFKLFEDDAGASIRGVESEMDLMPRPRPILNKRMNRLR